MKEQKQSFLERLTGTKKINDEESPVLTENFSPERTMHHSIEQTFEDPAEEIEEEDDSHYENEDDEEPGLAIDMYESDNELVLQGMIAGVTPENLHISITRTAVTIRGKRNAPQGIPEEHYISRELYWGTFSRVIELPYEINTEGAEAVEKYGLLIVRLPKLDTAHTQELKVKSI